MPQAQEQENVTLEEGELRLLEEITKARASLDHFEQLVKKGNYGNEFGEDFAQKMRDFFETAMDNYGLQGR